MIRTARTAACALYGLATAVFALDMRLHSEQTPPEGAPPPRGAPLPGLPLLAPDEPMKNAAVVRQALSRVPDADGEGCRASPRSFAVLLQGHLSWVRFDARTVCQLQLLKRISTAQP